MIRKVISILTFGLILLAQFAGLQRCATPTPPRGGDRDTIGPVLVLEETTPNFQTNFRPERIELTFDEWVELDPQQEIIISPPLELGADNRPVLRRRTLVIPLEGLELRDSVTYVVNIGAAIKDLNEGNPTENLRFVFATGPVLDTASVRGTVVDAFGGEPLEDIAVTLYDDLADTAVFTDNPTYFAVTGEEGDFLISNVRPGNYRAVALQRNPGATGYFADYTGVFPPLAVGFLDSIVAVGDGDNDIGTLRVSPVPVTPRVNDMDVNTFGVIKLAINQDAANVDLFSAREYLRNDFGDTLRLYYRQPVGDTILIGRNGVYTDTVFFDAQAAGGAVRLPLTAIDRSRGKINPEQGVRLLFNRPVEAVDTSRIRLYQDTLPDPVGYSYDIDTLFPAELRVRSRWSETSPYNLEILPGAVTDWYGDTNPDTIRRSFNVEALEALGDLRILFANLNPTVSYLLRLIDGNGEVIVGTRRFINERFDYVAEYRSLQPGNYRMELIYDSNNNRRYDAGDLRFGLQPEAVRRFEIEPLRANWTVEKTIDLENN